MVFITNLLKCRAELHISPLTMTCVTVLTYTVPHLEKHVHSCVIHYVSKWILNEGTHSGHQLETSLQFAHMFIVPADLEEYDLGHSGIGGQLGLQHS